jgi:hypothetical protein
VQHRNSKILFSPSDLNSFLECDVLDADAWRPRMPSSELENLYASGLRILQELFWEDVAGEDDVD